jgi:predicted RNA-binding Zn ribbon-like protein
MARPTDDPGLAGLIAEPGEGLCLDFVNTRYWRGSPSPVDELHAASDLLAWAAAKAGVDPDIVARLGAGWMTRPREAATAFAAAVELREALHRVFAAVAEAREVAETDLEALNAGLAGAAPRRHLAGRERGYSWDTALPGRSAAGLLSPVLWSAADLLAGMRRERVRQCANPRCRWLFLDDSKGGNRRWCSMAACGNRAKAHRHYLRRKHA